MKKPEKNLTESKYAYYSLVLEEPFSSLEELAEAEEAHFAKLKAKEDKAAEKKADAKKVEDAFKALNAARKHYKEQLATITENYSRDLKELKEAFVEAKEIVEKNLAFAEGAYSDALKAFGEKYPEGYHLTLKDGDFETTISQETGSSKNADDLFKYFFDIMF